MSGVPTDDPRAGERLLASACKFLRDGGDDDLARLLASCSATVNVGQSVTFFGDSDAVLDIHMIAPREAFDVLDADHGSWPDEQQDKLFRAIDAVITPPMRRGSLTVRAALIEPADDWRSEYGATKPRAPDFKAPTPELPAAPADDDIPF